MAKLPKKLKEKWVTALRSGEYKQGMGMLHAVENGSDKFCCLGVLCDVYNKQQKAQKKKQLKVVMSQTVKINKDCEVDHTETRVRYDDNDVYLPSLFESYITFPEQRRLANLNDKQVTFFGLAEYIEKNL